MAAPITPGSIVVLDFGGQYAHLIASRIRRLGAYSEVRLPETPAAELAGAAGIILSGGPQSVYEAGSPQADPQIFTLNIPILGLCYGHQWMAQALGGSVATAKVKEYGKMQFHTDRDSRILAAVPGRSIVWMSHGDEVTAVPSGFAIIGHTEHCAIAAMANEERRFYGIQNHIEVTHSEYGQRILQNFVDICQPRAWSMENFVEHVSQALREAVGARKVFMLVSGGVDSTVAFTLLNRVFGSDRVVGLLVDTGLMRQGEVTDILAAFKELGVRNLHVVDASDDFFTALSGVTDPETKRKRIGQTFLDVQRRVSAEMGIDPEQGWLLGQGTIYPDTIESKGTKHSDHIKTHHNRVEAIALMIERGLVIEPLKELYKDEVRILGEQLGLPRALVWRHPFPGPGLGVRILCADGPVPCHPSAEQSAKRALALADHQWVDLPVRSVGVQGDGRTYRHAVALYTHHPAATGANLIELATAVPNAVHCYNRVLHCTSHDAAHKPTHFHVHPAHVTRARADRLRAADAIVREEVQASGLYDAIWQFPVVLLPMGTAAGQESIVLRPITSTDAMTAEAFALPEAVTAAITRRILALDGIDTVFYDLTSKPPGTIEWE